MNLSIGYSSWTSQQPRFHLQPNYDNMFPNRLNQMKGKVKIRAALEAFGLKTGIKNPVRLFVGGDGKINGRCLDFSFNFLCNFVKRFLKRTPRRYKSGSNH
ncbi:hypothetical protein PVAND_002350 [Polypedilum vanderplanki]|uniref:Uncharacterized protein n=1 Tax=Polypedilum vanderplanki TaxID=319348 RepID=A0A9J6BRC5_POLVA|nr:hypothetical protein PVAND_002350 [Polypedilum vanderplanki]